MDFLKSAITTAISRITEATTASIHKLNEYRIEMTSIDESVESRNQSREDIDTYQHTAISGEESGGYSDTNHIAMASIDKSVESGIESREDIDTDQHTATSGEESSEYSNTTKKRLASSTDQSGESGNEPTSADESGVCSNIVHGTSNHNFLKYRHLKSLARKSSNSKCLAYKAHPKVSSFKRFCRNITDNKVT